MNPKILPLLSAAVASSFLFSACGVQTGTKPGAPTSTTMYSGVWIPGSNLTEPRPKQSAYFKTEAGGVAVMPEASGLFLTVSMVKPVPKPMYATIEYENPGGGTLRNDAMITPSMKGMTFSVPRSQTGLRPFTTYTVTVRLFNSKGDAKPVDVLSQNIRSYVDTTGPQPRVFKGMKSH